MEATKTVKIGPHHRSIISTIRHRTQREQQDRQLTVDREYRVQVYSQQKPNGKRWRAREDVGCGVQIVKKLSRSLRQHIRKPTRRTLVRSSVVIRSHQKLAFRCHLSETLRQSGAQQVVSLHSRRHLQKSPDRLRTVDQCWPFRHKQSNRFPDRSPMGTFRITQLAEAVTGSAEMGPLQVNHSQVVKMTRQRWISSAKYFLSSSLSSRGTHYPTFVAISTLIFCHSPVCVSDKSRTRRGHPYLQQPITLRCGHTMCLSHVDLAKYPAPNLEGIPATESHTRLTTWNVNRLAAWATASCPIPFCRQHKPSEDSASAATEQSTANDTSNARSASAADASSERGGVELFPPSGLASSNAPALSAGDIARSGDRGAPVDFTISKVLSIILAELERERLASLPPSMRPRSPALDIEADVEDTEDTSDSASVDDAEPSRQTTAFALPLPGDPSFLPPGHTSSRPRHSRHHANSTVEPGHFKRRRSAATETVKSPSAASPPHKRSTLPLGVPTPQLRHYSHSFEKELALTLECDVCTSLFYEPITTPCGHTFCSRCLARSLDHSTRCPVCRQNLPSFAFYQDHPINKVLSSVVLTAFPAELEERRKGIEEEERDARLDTPIFVCALAFPGMPTILHVFEPRYRLMLRRCVESGTPRFGMVMPARGTGNPNVAGLMEYGTMLDIKSIQMLPDGRSMVETMGAYRFRLLEKGSLDGYTVGRVERIDDISSEDEALLERISLERARNSRSQARQAARTAQVSASQEMSLIQGSTILAANGSTPSTTTPNTRPSLSRALSTDHQPLGAASIGLPDLQPGETEPSTEELMASCKAFIEQLRSGSAPWLLQRLNNTYGPMPEDPSLFSFWMALVSESSVSWFHFAKPRSNFQVMPIDEYEKARLLPIRSARLRLRLIAHWVDQLRSSWWYVFEDIKEGPR